MERKQDVLENLQFADMELAQRFPNCKELELIVIGGASMILKGYISRFTVDIDTIVDLEEEVKEVLWHYSINNDSKDVFVLPPDYMFRLQKVNVQFEVLKVYVISDEDLIISKVAGYRERDISDLKSGIMNKVNSDLLIRLGEQVARHSPEFAANWNRFRKELFYV